MIATCFDVPPMTGDSLAGPKNNPSVFCRLGQEKMPPARKGGGGLALFFPTGVPTLTILYQARITELSWPNQLGAVE